MRAYANLFMKISVTLGAFGNCYLSKILKFMLVLRGPLKTAIRESLQLAVSQMLISTGRMFLRLFCLVLVCPEVILFIGTARPLGPAALADVKRKIKARPPYTAL